MSVDRRLESIQDLDSTVTDPLVMYMFAAWKHHRINRDGLLRMLADLESYLFRRMVCSVSSNGLNKLVPSLIAKLESAEHDLAETFAALLLTERYEVDADTARKDAGRWIASLAECGIVEE